MTVEIDLQKHWDEAYESKALHELGWYEKTSNVSLKLIQNLRLEKNAHILSVGAGASTLIDELLDAGYSNITAIDISTIAMKLLKERLQQRAKNVSFLVDDLTKPKKLHLLEPVDLWQDRAMLHFLTKKEEQDSYFKSVNKLVKPGGYALIGIFSKEGAKKCSGLEIQQYDHRLLQEKIGNDFKLIKYLNYTHLTPSASPRPYIYTVFQRK
ncbi:MAG: class I SAM-dependent methyltransferase [Flavobacteriaceae bacterium]|nr:class I SAM-dependent methyltransferase [Flavobacteriaceae bacterium]